MRYLKSIYQCGDRMQMYKKVYSKQFYLHIGTGEIISIFIKGTVSPPERCDFTSSQQYSNNVL